MAKRVSVEKRKELVSQVVSGKGKGKLVREVADTNGVGRSTLARWVQQIKEKDSSSAETRKSRKSLEAEMSLLREEYEILKKAQAYFAKRSR